jgi:ankyrin repeat protein
MECKADLERSRSSHQLILSFRFQWVYCQLEVLRHCFPTNVRHVIDELPESLDETYNRILKQIPKANRQHAYRLLQHLMIAFRPLRVKELAELLALDFSAGAIPKLNMDWRWEDQEEAVLSACSSLVTVIVHKRSRIVQFSHFSVVEFLTSQRLARSMEEVSRFHIPIRPSHAILAHACLSVLLRLDDRTDKDSAKNIPLFRYAAKYWVGHAKIGNVEPHVMDDFLDMERPHFSAWVLIHGLHETFSVVRSGWPIELLPSAAPLYLAADKGIHCLLKHLVVKHPQLVNAWGGEHGTPLHVSVVTGHIEIAQLLLTHGADINSCSADECTPLHLASKVGNLELGRWLLSHGADVNPQEADGSTPLHLAATHGHLDVSRLLLEHDADINALDDHKYTPLLDASANGNTDVVHLLLDHRADIHARDNRGNTPLHIAASQGHLEVVRILLALNAEVNSRSDDGSTPLLGASASGNLDVVRLLLDNNAVADVRDDSGNTPLHQAASCDCLEIARILLELDAEVNAQDDEGSTALHLASGAWQKGHPEVVRLLLNHGAETHVRDNRGSTALHIAAFHGCLAVSQILLRHNAEIDARDDHRSTPLLRASKAGHLDVVQLLLDHKADAHVRDSSGNTALHLAAAGGGFGLEIRRLAKLFETKEEVNSRINEESSQSRQISSDGEDSGEGSPDVVRLFLDHGVDVQVCNTSGKTASDVARGPRRQQILQLLSGDAVEFTNQRSWSDWDMFFPSLEELLARMEECESDRSDWSL